MFVINVVQRAAVLEEDNPPFEHSPASLLGRWSTIRKCRQEMRFVITESLMLAFMQNVFPFDIVFLFFLFFPPSIHMHKLAVLHLQVRLPNQIPFKWHIKHPTPSPTLHASDKQASTLCLLIGCCVGHLTQFFYSFIFFVHRIPCINFFFIIVVQQWNQAVGFISFSLFCFLGKS